MTDEEFLELKNAKNCGPDFDKWIRDWNFDLACIGVVPVGYIVYKIVESIL